MRIKSTPGVFVRMPIATGQTIVAGKAVAGLNGEAVLADKDSEYEVIGLAKEISAGKVYIQVQGKFPSTQTGNEFWIGTNGDLVNTVPTTGIVQKVATRIDNQNILIDVDKTVILL